MVLGRKNQLFPREKMVLGRKTNFFLGKTKNHHFGLWPHSFQKDVLFGFFGFP